MSIDIVNDGAVSTGDVYPQPGKTGVLYNAYLIKPKSELKVIPKTLMFFASAIQKAIKPLYGYEKKASWDRVKNDVISLPISNGEIDFDFINALIEEIEEERLSNLYAFLKANGLLDYDLTPTEIIALKDIDAISFSTYNLKSLFGNSTRGKRLKSEDRVPGKLPFVTAGESEEGVSDFIGNKVTVFSKNTITIDMFGSAKYRSFEYGADDHVAVVHTEKLKENAAIFVASAIHKSSHNGQFDYGRNFYPKDADSLDILLPERDGAPDYAVMELIIKAVKKLIIKGVVDYTNNKLQNHKTLLN